MTSAEETAAAMMNETSNGSTQRLKCMKYSLMIINSFGVLLGFFIVLFGMSYPTVPFPGGYDGRDTAMIAGVFIFFSLIGYCGAAHKKIFFLLPYAVAIFFGMLYNFFKVLTSEQQSCLDPKSLSLSGLLILLLGLALFLIYKIKQAATIAGSGAVSMDSMEKSSTTRSTSSIVHISKLNQRK